MIDTQYICTPEVCGCIDDDDKYSCDCEIDLSGTVCLACDSSMVLIDVDNGQVIQVHIFMAQAPPDAECESCGQPQDHAVHQEADGG